MRMTLLSLAVVSIAAIGSARGAAAVEIKVLTAGAFKQVLLALVPEFEKADRPQGHDRQRHRRCA